MYKVIEKLGRAGGPKKRNEAIEKYKLIAIFMISYLFIIIAFLIAVTK